MLWFFAFAVVALIYLTLGLAGALAELIGDRALNATTFVVGALLVLATIATQGIKRSVGVAEIFVWLGIGATLVLVVTRLASPVERSHLMEYAVVAVLIYQALLERRRNGRPVPRPAWLAIGATTLLGFVDELIQVVVPNRVFDPVDIVFNTAAAVAAVGASVFLGWTRRRRFDRSRIDTAKTYAARNCQGSVGSAR
ncbi:MAG: VanZ family protein [Acidimicrobiia bacterium]